ncbi:hypothetical protein MMC08_003196, partial [Hypocenomyce scalaris]|nr:hypothetical protein [Hypocenomyce scalaris]
MANEIFELPEEAKMKLAKKTFRKENSSRYRGYVCGPGSVNLEEYRFHDQSLRTAYYNMDGPKRAQSLEQLFPCPSRLHQLERRLRNGPFHTLAPNIHFYPHPIQSHRVQHRALLHQDPTGGLKVPSASNVWIRALYISRSIMINIGDLMAK